MRDCQIIASRKKGKRVEPSVPKEDFLTRSHFYELSTRGEKPNNSDDNIGKFLFHSFSITSF